MADSPEASFAELKQQQQSLQLSTLTAEGKANASYAPFVMDDDGNFYIFVSGLASHTQDLLANPDVSLLLMQDESETRQIFARRRAGFQCQASVVGRDDAEYVLMLDKLEDRFGNIVQMLRGLADFVLFRLRPYQGQFVMGFGKAYELGGDNLQELKHINPEAD